MRCSSGCPVTRPSPRSRSGSTTSSKHIWPSPPTAAGQPITGGRPPTSRGDLQVTGDALRDRLHRAGTAHHCVVLVVDDAHLADRPSLAALGYALRRLPDEPIVTVLATRPEGTIGLPRGLLTMIDTGGLRLDLNPLSVDEVRELAGHYGHHDVNERAARRLREHAGGSPLHLRALLQRGPASRRRVAVRTPPGTAPLRPPGRHPARPAVAGRARPGESGSRPRTALRSLRSRRDGRRGGSAHSGRRAPYGADRRCGANAARSRAGVRPQRHPGRGAPGPAARPTSPPTHRAAAEVTRGPEALSHLAKATAGYDLDLADRLAAQARDDIARGGWRTAATR